MPYRYLPEIAIADVAFEAWAETLEDLFRAAADATMNVMVGNLDTIAARETRFIRVEETEVDMLLFQLLQELLFFKDAEQLLLRIKDIEIRRVGGNYQLKAEARGEVLDPGRHDLVVDVKAVTLHRFRVERSPRGWDATVILDV
ncbi:MAG: archease [Acidobacteriota bacterium]|jgi:SHS2 domain-containing protein